MTWWVPATSNPDHALAISSTGHDIPIGNSETCSAQFEFSGGGSEWIEH